MPWWNRDRSTGATKEIPHVPIPDDDDVENTENRKEVGSPEPSPGHRHRRSSEARCTAGRRLLSAANTASGASHCATHRRVQPRPTARCAGVSGATRDALWESRTETAAATRKARQSPTKQKSRKPQPTGCLTEPSHYNLRTRKKGSSRSSVGPGNGKLPYWPDLTARTAGQGSRKRRPQAA